MSGSRSFSELLDLNWNHVNFILSEKESSVLEDFILKKSDRKFNEIFNKNNHTYLAREYGRVYHLSKVFLKSYEHYFFVNIILPSAKVLSDRIVKDFSYNVELFTDKKKSRKNLKAGMMS